MATVTAPDGATISYESTGAGPALILVHGITDSHAVWDPLVAPLAEDFKVVAVDLRGHGASDRRPPYDVFTMAADVHAVARAAHAVDPLVVGHSLGGAVVTMYAATFPTRGVVNIDQPLRLAAFKAALTSIEPMLRADDASFRAVMDQIVRSNYGPLPASEQARIEAGGSVEQDVVLGVWDIVFSSSEEALDAQVADAVRTITAPYLALHGDDPGPEYPAWLRSNVAHSTLEIWPEHGHFPHLVEPARFLDRIHDFAHDADAP